MSKKPGIEVTQDRTSASTVTHRLLVEHPTLGWKKLPMQQVHPILSGTQLLPELAGRTVRIATAMVIWERGKVRELLSLEPSEWAFDSEGRMDRDALIRGIAEKLDAEHGMSSEGNVRTAEILHLDVIAICACLGLGEPNARRK